MPHRHDLVKKVLSLLPAELDVHDATKTWFYDIRKSGGFRLTDRGLEALRMAGLQSWTVPLGGTKLTKQLILDMNRRIEWPYYISTKPPCLILFSDRDAVMAQLYGDLTQWIANLSK
jgi:hypothetical protein